MLPYLIIFLLLALAAIAYEVKPFKEKGWLVFIALLLLLFAGLRAPYIDKDYLNYETGLLYIEDVNDASSEELLPFFEPAFYLLAITAKWLFPTQFVLAIMLVYAAASVWLKTISIRLMSINPFMVLLLYFSQYFLLHEMTQIRIGLASGMFFIGLYYLCHGYRNRFIGIILFACLFHYSAALYLLVLLFNNQSFNRVKLLLMLLLTILLGVVQLPLIQVLRIFGGTLFTKVDNYIKLIESGQADQINTFNVLSLLNIGVALVLVLFIPRSLLTENKYAAMHIKVMVLSVLVLSAFSALPSIAFRLSELFSVVGIFSVYYLRYIIPNRIIAIAAMLFLAAAIFYITLFYGQLLQPYHSVIGNW